MHEFNQCIVVTPILELMVPPLSGAALLLDLGGHRLDPRLATLFSSYTQRSFRTDR